MPRPVTCPPIRLCIAAIATVISLCANATDHEIRIGRYQTVNVDAPSQEIEIAPRLQPIALPDHVTTRGEALDWILQQYGYQPARETNDLLRAARLLATLLPATKGDRPVEPLREMLQWLLGPHVEILVDSEAKQVSLFIDAQAAGGPDGYDRSE